MEDILVLSGLSQAKACYTCKFTGRCSEAPHGLKGIHCPASDGMHYPKDAVRTETFQIW